MIPYPHINPDIIRIGPLHLRWYGLMYALGLLASYFLIKGQEKNQAHRPLLDCLQDCVKFFKESMNNGNYETLSDFLFTCAWKENQKPL
jgi:prolipoprotein diacylglyceryltransferase